MFLLILSYVCLYAFSVVLTEHLLPTAEQLLKSIQMLIMIRHEHEGKHIQHSFRCNFYFIWRLPLPFVVAPSDFELCVMFLHSFIYQEIVWSMYSIQITNIRAKTTKQQKIFHSISFTSLFSPLKVYGYNKNSESLITT